MNHTDISGLKDQLLEHQDLKFKAFSAKLMPEIDPDTVLGVRMPVLRRMAKTMEEQKKAAFLKDLPHAWHEENMLHVLLIDRMQDAGAAWQEYVKLQPHLHTWALTDTLSMKSMEDEQLLEKALGMLESDDSFIRRQAVIWIMKRGLKKKNVLDMVRRSLSAYRGEREVRLALGWMLCEGVCRNREVFLPYLMKENMDVSVLAAAVSKCRDSRRIARPDVQLLKERLEFIRQAGKL